MHKAGLDPQDPINQGWWCTTVISATLEEIQGLELQVLPQLHSKLETNLSCMKPWLTHTHTQPHKIIKKNPKEIGINHIFR